MENKTYSGQVLIEGILLLMIITLLFQSLFLKDLQYFELYRYVESYEQKNIKL